MPVLVKFDNTTSCPQQAQILEDATPYNDGVMTKAQAAALARGGGKAFQYTVLLGDGDDFTVAIPLAKRPSTVNYKVDMTIQSGLIFTLYQIPFANQTTTSFRVLTDGELAVGTLVGFTITEF